MTKSSSLKKHNYFTRSKPLKEFEFNDNTKPGDGGLKLKPNKNPENDERNKAFTPFLIQNAHEAGSYE